MLNLRKLIAAWLLVLVTAGVARAEIAVIVNNDSGVSQMSRQEVVNIYMGRYAGLSSGITAFPVDMQSLRAEFYQRLVDRTLPEINSYWARLVFSGRASPPRQVDDVSAVLEVVSNNKGAIGYLPSSALADEAAVRVVHRLPEE